MSSKIDLLVVCGPTASGKTKFAVDLALHYGGEIISADSMQIYREMRIGTARPTTAEMRGVTHHLLGFLEPDQSFSVAQYTPMAKEAIADIHKRGKLPILAGGTGLYINSIVDNIAFAEMPENSELREELTDLSRKNGCEYLWGMLFKCDPELAARLHPNNLGRVIRGIEVFRLSGIPLSQWQAESRLTPSDYQPCMIGLSFANRQVLYDRINDRVDQMMRDGLLEEARFFYQRQGRTSAQAIGYKELFDYFEEKISLEEAIYIIKQQTRRYAKRQLTWLRRDPRIHWLYVDNYINDAELFAAACKRIDHS